METVIDSGLTGHAEGALKIADAWVRLALYIWFILVPVTQNVGGFIVMAGLGSGFAFYGYMWVRHHDRLANLSACIVLQT